MDEKSNVFTVVYDKAIYAHIFKDITKHIYSEKDMRACQNFLLQDTLQESHQR